MTKKNYGIFYLQKMKLKIKMVFCKNLLTHMETIRQWFKQFGVQIYVFFQKKVIIKDYTINPTTFTKEL